jgi:sodium-dependent dicarboxylate transporter 2/3/5
MSNAAAVSTLMPMTCSVIDVICSSVLVGDDAADLRVRQHFAAAMLIGLAYAASLGGVTTLIGTPPNLLLADYVETMGYGVLAFADWMAVGVPIGLSLLLTAWFILTRVVFRGIGFSIPSDIQNCWLEHYNVEVRAWGKPHTRVVLIFLGTVLSWIFFTQEFAEEVLPTQSTTVYGVCAVIALLTVPSGAEKDPPWTPLMTWDEANRSINWGILILMSGGLALGNAVDKSGLATKLGEVLLHVDSPVGLRFASCYLMTFLTEVTSNTAVASIFIPILGSVTAADPSQNAFLLLAPTIFCSSCAFMLPIATPPNAIVFGSGRFRTEDMCKAGFLMNCLAPIVIVGLCTAIIPALPSFEYAKSSV